METSGTTGDSGAATYVQQASEIKGNLQADGHGGPDPIDGNGQDSCGAHLCLTAIVIGAANLAAFPRHMPCGPAHDAIKTSRDNNGLYRPPIILL